VRTRSTSFDLRSTKGRSNDKALKGCVVSTALDRSTSKSDPREGKIAMQGDSDLIDALREIARGLHALAAAIEDLRVHLQQTSIPPTHHVPDQAEPIEPANYELYIL
jgi:hypothetical protein